MAIRVSDRDLPFLTLFGAWFVFYYNGLFDKVIIRIKVLPVWIIFIVSILFLSYVLLRGRVIFKVYDFLFLFLFIFLFPSFYSHFSAYSFSVLSIFFCVLASIRCGHSWTLSKNQKQFIADVGLVTAILSLFMFFYFSFWDRPVWGEASIRPGYGYAIDRGVLLRLVGFSEDPNFFVIGSLLPFLICLCEKHLKRRVITIAVLGLAMVFTFSRSGFFTVIAAVASYYFLRIKVSHLKFIVPFAIALVPIVLIGFSYFDDLKVNDSADVDRGFVSGLLSRSALLSILLEKESFSFFGNGLGISKEILGIHSHNTYFDFLFEGGVVPFVVFVVITLSYIFSAFYKPSLIKSYGVGVIIGASAVSISFQPLLSLVILLGSKYADKEH